MLSPQTTKLLSPSRLQPYLNKVNHCEIKAYELYIWNLKICESFYTVLNFLEISLRNQIDYGISKNFHSNWILNSPFNFSPIHNKDISEVLQKNPKYQHNDLIAGLNFGFWNGLFNRYYDVILWHKHNMTKEVFPHLSKNLMGTNHIRNELYDIRYFRNRIFHYEPIWNWKFTPLEMYNRIMNLLHGLSVEIHDICQNTNNFHKLYLEKPSFI